jgi:hypothetical protein
MEIALGPPKHENMCVDVSRPECTGMYYVIHRYLRVEKHKFGITCPDMLFVESIPIPSEHEK